jgi:filamentous hemagglutinin
MDTNRGHTFVGENLGTPRNAAMQAARDFESGTPGAFSDIATGQRQVPALRFDNPNPNGSPYVEFDGYQPLDKSVIELIDSKTRIVPFATKDEPFISPSVRDGLVRKSEAMAQNPNYRGVIELPTATARREAQLVLRQLGITNISTRIRR